MAERTLDEIVAAAGGDPLAAAIDSAKALLADGKRDGGLQVLESVVEVLEERLQEARSR